MTRHLTGLALLLLLAALAPRPAIAEQPTPAAAEFFEKKVRPLLVERCFACHGKGKTRGGLMLTSRAAVLEGGESGPAAVAGQPEKSRLIRAIRHEDERLQMPPKKKLSPREIDVLERWVKMGLPWPRGSEAPAKNESFQITPAQRAFWAYRPIRLGAPPAVKNAWPETALDNFVLAGLERKGLSPARPADRRTLLRRATFDLTGLPPTPQEMESFLADHSPGAFARVVERLLASPRYGERWGRHWLDVVRYADARDLIQLPPASDFREAWRYRDWVVGSFNRDLPYRDFVQYQVAGDLLQPRDPEQMNQDALVATGMLAIADFVPGDVDKDLMIADYVNDQIDVVGRAFLGLTLACARCHDHKFDPVSTADYYGLAGIFFSTRLIPGPVLGNTPLVRVPLLPKRTVEKARAKYADDLRRRTEIQQELSVAADKEHLASLKRLATTQTARYLVAACAYKHRASRKPAVSLAEFAREQKLDARLLAGWVHYLGGDRPTALGDERARFREAAAGKLDRVILERSARELQRALVKVAAERERESAARSPEQKALAAALLLHFRADDPHLLTAGGQVTLWPNRGAVPADAGLVLGRRVPSVATAKINGRAVPVVRFAGRELLEARQTVPPAGSLFAVYAVSRAGKPGQRLIGWEDAAVGRHGLGLMLAGPGGLHAILRNNGQSGDIAHSRKGLGDFEIVSVTWGERGTTLHRDRAPAGANKSIRSLSADPAIAALRIGGPGSGGAPGFHGDLAEVRVYNRQLDAAARARIETELHATWFSPTGKKDGPASRGTQLYEELISPRGPFWLKPEDRAHVLPANVQARLAALRQELAGLKNIRPLVVPEAVVVQDGGPKGTRHEGFRDAHIYLRGDHKKLGKKVPRRFPVLLAGDRQPAITEGSGRLQLANWLTRPEHPLTARVMVNRIWQHHFGEGIVRTPNNFGERGERPTHPELLDYLADHFIRSGWSVKAMHRLIMLSSAYQQSARASGEVLAQDPDNRLFGRMNRRRLEAEAIRDSLLAVAGRLDSSMGGPAFADLAVPRRTIYLMSARTGANTSDFGALFDRADPTSIVERRSVSTVAPQALFFLNDPFVTVQARALAERVAREAPAGHEETIRQLYGIVCGRLPSRAEMAVGLRLLGPTAGGSALERYCHALLCTNEFLYVD